MKKSIRFRPSPAMRTFSRVFSGIFALIGLAFVGFGVGILSNGAGLFGAVFTLMACCFVGIGVYGAVSKNGLYGLHWGGAGIEITDEETGDESAEERLKKLQALYDQRLITTEEYDSKRQEILKEL